MGEVMMATTVTEKQEEWLPPSEPQKSGAKIDTTVDELASAITAEHHFGRDAGGRLYAYRGGVYQLGGDRVVRQAVKHLMIGWGLAAKWQSRKANEVVEFIAVDSPELWTDPP